MTRVLALCLMALAVIALSDAADVCYKDQEVKATMGECGEITQKGSFCAVNQEAADAILQSFKDDLAGTEPTKATCVATYTFTCLMAGAQTKLTDCKKYCDMTPRTNTGCENDDQCAEGYKAPEDPDKDKLPCCSNYENQWKDWCDITSDQITTAIDALEAAKACAKSDCVSAGSHTSASFVLVAFLALFAVKFY